MTVFVKDADSTTDYSVDWKSWLTSDETLVSANWSVVPTGDANDLTLSSDSITGSVCGTYVAGGQVGYRYRLTCRVVTDAGRTDDRSITLKILER